MSKASLSRLFLRLLIAATVLAGLATITWAQRYELPAQEDILMQINDPRHEHLNPEQINILVWNLQKGIRDSWANDYHLLTKDKDILFLQEVLLNEKMAAVLRDNDDYAYQVATSFSDSWDNHIVTGVATASMASPVTSSYLRSTHREPVIATPKMAIINEYALANTGKTLLTANIHAINFVSAEKHRHMLGELEAELAGHKGPMILAGDFNTWTEDKTQSLMQMSKRLGLSEVSFAGDDRTRILGNALDWVFARGLSVEASRIHSSVDGSDHKPIEVAFSVSGQE